MCKGKREKDGESETLCSVDCGVVARARARVRLFSCSIRTVPTPV